MDIPNPSELHIFIANIDADSDNFEPLQLLDAKEKTRAGHLRAALHQKRFIKTRATLRMILSHYLKAPPQDISLAYTANGKPYIEHSELQFNVSHSQGFAVYALTRLTPIGIDIEKVQPQYHERVAKRYFSPGEYDYYSRLLPNEKINTFYKLWTSKEAVIKALGQKLSTVLASSISIPVDEISNTSVAVQLNHLSPPNWHLKFLDIIPHYQLAVATSNKPHRLLIWEWTAQGIKPLQPDNS
jgi:4'-phosphopantetheinyl transferase